jgi:hypothetical protein
MPPTIDINWLTRVVNAYVGCVGAGPRRVGTTDLTLVHSATPLPEVRMNAETPQPKLPMPAFVVPIHREPRCSKTVVVPRSKCGESDYNGASRWSVARLEIYVEYT